MIKKLSILNGKCKKVLFAFNNKLLLLNEVDNPAKLKLTSLNEKLTVKEPEKDTPDDSEKSSAKKIVELVNDELADELAILNLLGGWNE